MDMNDYQTDCRRTAIYHDSDRIDIHQGLHYTVFGLLGEAGEIAQVLKKYLRDGGTVGDMQQRMAKELGDLLWYIAMTADELDLSLNGIAQQNLNKLKDRQNRGVLGGSGDER